MSACTGTPISWLRLEQHHAGELSAAASAEIQAHLASCATCTQCFDRIVADAARPLRELPRAAKVAPARVLLLRRAAMSITALAAAAAALLIFRHPEAGPPEGFESPSARVKGGDISLTLVRDDDTMLAEAGGTYRDGDRWKAQISCPPGMQAAWDLVVYENGVAAFPLAAPSSLSCGNAIPLAGAFRTTGHEPMTVCLVWGDGAEIDRRALLPLGPSGLPHSVCKELTPTPAP